MNSFLRTLVVVFVSRKETMQRESCLLYTSIAATQFPDGSAYHQYQPLTKKGNMDIGSGFNDDPLWLIAAVYAYLGETGDYSILDEPVDFNNDHSLAPVSYTHLDVYKRQLFVLQKNKKER